MWKLIYTHHAAKDAKKLKSSNLEDKAKKLLSILKEDPYTLNPGFKKLVGPLSGTYSRRINIQHRIVYQVYDQEKIVKIIRMWTHYEG